MSATGVVLRAPQIFGLDLETDGDVWDSFVNGWASFTDWQLILPLVVNVLLAVLLMLPSAYGQQRLGRLNSLARVNEQKALVVYAAVSAAIAVLLLEHPATALVVFGMGGLLRFRTRTSAEGGTGRGIAAVVVGLACGLSLYALAVTLTIVGYVVMRWMQGRIALELTVVKPSAERLEESLQAYRAVLEEYGCTVVGTRTATEDKFTLVLLLPRGVELHEMKESFRLKISDELQGEIHLNLGD